MSYREEQAAILDLLGRVSNAVDNDESIEVADIYQLVKLVAASEAQKEMRRQLAFQMLCDSGAEFPEA